MNRDFVAIKVDREERPDVDAVYMAGHPGADRAGRLADDACSSPRTVARSTPAPTSRPVPGTACPSFGEVLDAIAAAWRDRRDEVLSSAGRHRRRARRSGTPRRLPGEVTVAGLDHARAELQREFDEVRGGFGGAPKFPPSMVLEGLLRLRVTRRR